MTFWLARSRVRSRPSERPVMASAITESSAASTNAAPSPGEAREARLPATASAVCQACPSAQLGLHQNGSSRAVRLAPALLASSWPQSQAAARRSASVPAPRPEKPSRFAIVSAGRIGGGHGRTAAMTEAELLQVAREAAEAAAAELLPRFGGRSHTRADGDAVRAKSTPTDLVSDADLAAEAAIRAVLKERRPEDAILAEEGGASGGGELRWLVDPLDGTINFLFGIPAF